MAAPAQAASPTTVFDFESNTVGDGGWGNMFGFAADGNGWANTVDAATGLPTGSPASGTKAIKATEGSGAYSGTNVGGVATTDSLLGVGTMGASVVFYSPTAGATVRLKVEQANDNTYSNFVTDDQVTVAGWQTLVFDFTTPTTGTFNAGINYSLGSVSFDPTATTLQTLPYYVDQVRFNVPMFNFESNTVGDGGWGNMFGFAADSNGWANTVDAATGLPTGSPAGETKAIKATEGSGAYSGTNLGGVASTASLIGTGSLTATVVFYSPTAGATLRLKVEQANDNTYSNFVTDDQVTVAGWQTLEFDFGSPSSGTFNSSINYSLASVSFDPTATTLQTLPYYVDKVVFASGVAQQQQAPAQATNYDVRLISSQKNTATDAYEFTSCGGASWCVDNNYYMKMIAAGASTTLNYVVTNRATNAPVASASVSLRMNTSYSGSNATWSSGGTNYGAVSTSNSSDGGVITGTTNGSGEVSFTFTNTNTSGEATRTLNSTNPYPEGCLSPAGQTKGALQPTVTAVSGATIGTQYVDVLWPHISSSTINSSIALGADGSNCSTPAAQDGPSFTPLQFDQDNKGRYPHVRLEKSLLNQKLDATWWDGVWQYRDADTRAYLKYIPVGSTFALTYHVTDEYGSPYVGAKVSLIVNANYSCAKTFFAYEGSLIGPDDCAGGGETELPSKTVGADGRVTFVLTNTNTTGEAMPADLNGAPNSATKEVGTNIKPNVVGAKQQGIDMLFAHFVDQAGVSKATGPGAKSATIGSSQTSEFTLTDDAGKPMANTDVKYFVNGFDSKSGIARTDATGKVRVRSTNSVGLEGMQTVGVSLVRDGKLPLAATATINWAAPGLSIAAAGASKSVVVKVAGAAGQTVQIKVAGKTYRRVAQSAITEFSIPSAAGKKSVSVKVGGKTLSRTVTVTK
jgi:hypothetical protein